MITEAILLTTLVLSAAVQGEYHRVKRQGNPCTTPPPRQQPGVCIDIKQCPSLLEILRNDSKDPDAVRYLQNSVCRFNGNVAIVCCPSQSQPDGAVRFDQNTNTCTTPAPDSRPGSCVNIRQCPVLLDILRTKKNDPVAIRFLQKSVCYYDRRDPVVCCQSNLPAVNPATQSSGNKFPGTKTCGISGVQHVRVVGGKPADLGSWPWITALGYVTATKPVPEWLCGGALVTENYVVTAAHCIVNTGRRMLTVARLGDLDLNDQMADGASPLDIKVEKTIPHENYNAARHTTDIALVKLADKVTFTKLISPICLPFPVEMRTNPFVGYTPFLAGWGALSYKGPSSTVLQEVQIDISDIPGCIRAYSNITGATIDQRVICAGRTGKDACQGDSGGPLMLPRGENYFLIGVVSYGYKCAEPGYPGIYTRVTEFVDWIDKNVQ